MCCNPHQKSLKILYVFTSTNEQPYLDIKEFGILPTWPKLVAAPSEVLALIATPPHLPSKMGFFIKSISDFYDRLRNNIGLGKYFMALSKYLLIPLSFWNPIAIKNGQTLTVRTPEAYLFMGFKHLAAYQYALENNFDFLVATNSSSFLNVPLIEDFLEELRNNGEPFYGGRPLPHNNPRGASGSFYILDRLALKCIYENRREWNHSKLDDIALRFLANNYNLEFQELTSIFALSPDEINLIPEETLTSCMHFKIGPYFNDGIRKDAENFKLLWVKFNTCR